MIEKCNRKSKKRYLAFVDIEKACDRLNIQVLGKVLKKCGINEQVVRIIENMHENTKARYTLSDIETE